MPVVSYVGKGTRPREGLPTEPRGGATRRQRPARPGEIRPSGSHGATSLHIATWPWISYRHMAIGMPMCIHDTMHGHGNTEFLCSLLCYGLFYSIFMVSFIWSLLHGLFFMVSFTWYLPWFILESLVWFLLLYLSVFRVFCRQGCNFWSPFLVAFFGFLPL